MVDGQLHVKVANNVKWTKLGHNLNITSSKGSLTTKAVNPWSLF